MVFILEIAKELKKIIEGEKTKMKNIKEEVLKEAGIFMVEGNVPEPELKKQIVARAIDLTLTEVGKVIDDWLNEYCSHGKDNCFECIKELKQKLGIK